MRCKISRFAGSLAVMSFLLTAIPDCRAFANLDDKQPSAQSIAALELKASQAAPKEQCFLYAELVHEMIEYSSAEYAAGDYQHGADTLKQVNGFAQKIHMLVTDNEKRLKNAQILLRHTAFRLTELLHSTSMEDHPLIEKTLAQVNQVQNEAMLQVFRK